MEIKLNLLIRRKYHQGFQRDSDPIRIVIHGTGGGSSSDSLIKWMTDGERAEEYIKGIALFHYLVDTQGAITEIISPEMWVYASCCGQKDKENINIELLNPSSDNNQIYTAHQYKALVDLIKLSYSDYPIKYITTHNYMGSVFSGKPEKCPGDGFAFAIFESYLSKYFVFEKTFPDYITINGLLNGKDN